MAETVRLSSSATLAIEVADLENEARIARARGAKVISISASTLTHKSNIRDFGHYVDSTWISARTPKQLCRP
jgi:hypothetical protein